MKSRPSILLIIALIALPHLASAQLLPEQRAFDFQNLVALYAKRYAPYDWKKQAVAFDLFDIGPWLARIQAAKDDLEFFEIQAEYVGKLQDTHSGFSMTSSFRANLGMTVDIYDNRVLIDSINRTQLPVATYPFQIGDEVVSVDGVSAEDWIARISTWRQWGNPASTRRIAAGQITFRSQPTFPRAAEIGTSAAVEIQRASGVLERYTVPWTKAGLAVTTVGKVPFPAPDTTAETSASAAEAFLDELHNYKLPENDLVLEPVSWAKDDDGVSRKYVNGLGSRAPIFAAGLPAGFVLRLGRLPADFHYSGIYTSGGVRIGYLRIPSFSPPLTAVNELRAEIDFLQRNTDGLVVDVMRNTGGGCYMLDVAAALIPHPFYFFGEQIRATQDRLNSFYALLELQQLRLALGIGSQLAVDTARIYVDEMKAALSSNRGVTDPIAACIQSGQITPAVMEGNAPGPVVYTKPMIVLIDEFSISAADIFPSMIQDNRRALLVGARGSGGGGSVSGWPTGFYSESISNNTNTLVVRKRPIVTADYPTAPYVENIGPRPDVPINYMTRANLMNGGRAFVDQFTQVIVDQVKKVPGPVPFTISNFGSVSLSTAGTSTDITIGYGRIQADPGRTAPSGLAIVGFRQRNVLVTEATVPATPLIQSGRIYVEMSGSVRTGIAIANPNNQPATIQFYFTGANGNTGAGSALIEANGQLAKFLDEAPFNGVKPHEGTFTLSSSVPVAVVALRGLTNERAELLFTTLPVSGISAPAAAGPFTFPHYADGGGWATQIVLVNPTDSQLAGAVHFFDPAGNATTLNVDGQTNSTFTYSIPPRGSQRLSTSGSPGSPRNGSVRVVPGASSATPSGLAVFSGRQSGVTVSEAAVPASASGSAFRLYAEVSGDFARGLIGSIQTGFALSNSSSAPVAVNLDLRRFDGSATGVTTTIQVPANGQISRFLYQIPGLTSLQLPFQGVLRISSATPVSVIGLRGRVNERRDALITTILAVNEASSTNTELFFPHLAEGGGYTTQFILFSGSSGQDSSGQLGFVSPSGTPLNLPLH